MPHQINKSAISHHISVSPSSASLRTVALNTSFPLCLNRTIKPRIYCAKKQLFKTQKCLCLLIFSPCSSSIAASYCVLISFQHVWQKVIPVWWEEIVKQQQWKVLLGTVSTPKTILAFNEEFSVPWCSKCYFRSLLSLTRVKEWRKPGGKLLSLWVWFETFSLLISVRL